MNQGTYDGDLEEISFVASFNSNKSLYKDYLQNFHCYDNLWMSRVTTKQISQLSEKKVFTRSDCYLIKALDDIQKLLIENNYYLLTII